MGAGGGGDSSYEVDEMRINRAAYCGDNAEGRISSFHVCSPPLPHLLFLFVDGERRTSPRVPVNVYAASLFSV